MNIARRQVLRIAAGAGALSVMPSGPGAAQTYPDRRVRIVVPYSAAGPTDVVVRILSDRLAAAWGKPVVVENRAGGGGNIGAEVVARASPDGYTLLANSSTHVINASLYDKLTYDPFKDFTPISEIGSYALIWVVHPSVPVKSLDELVALAKAQPGRVTVGNGGMGAPTQLCALLFAQVAGIEFLHVPYKGGAPASAAVVSGHVMAMCNSGATAIPQVLGGDLARACRRRSPTLAGAARLAHGWRARLSRLRGERLVGAVRAGQFAAEYHGQALCRHVANIEIARRSGEFGQTGLRRGRQFAR